ncbi:helix-turn-helix domain-containing protein [Paenibacillus koleovorans]|uniref:helix-turn-helix domain-containing protein n=1 Tax=Paenibacillus koleovorans TaxID=121608 RepID=UPI000FDBD461|nr:helix-turn-helix domain-containing protein [Paenibacillus koleovorans]
MSELGQLLKKARLENGLSLDQLEEMTKIRKRYLEAIETGEYKILPGSFYVRAFIKSYAESVGLDPTEVLALYRNVIPTPTPETIVEPIRRKKTHTRNTDKISKWASTILMIAFVMLILGVIYYFIDQSYDGSRQQVDENEKITDKSSPESKSQSGDGGSLASGNGSVIKTSTATPTPTPTPTPAAVLTKLRSEGSTDYYSLEIADKMNVKLNVIGEECWLRIDKMVLNGEGRTERQVLEQKLYKKGDLREWISDVNVYMTVGLPAAAEITVNGTPLLFGDLKNARNVQIELKKPAH